MNQETRTYLWGVVIGSVPDLIICWVAMRLTDSGWSGFFITYAVLQGIYLFFWLKTAVWSWLVFWVYSKKKIAAHFENCFIDSHYPVPNEYAGSLEDYLGEIKNNNAVDANTRVKAASDHGTLNGLKIANRYSMLLQFSLAGKIAMERYAHPHEATQEPALTNDDADWTRLDQLAMDIARLETLTSWHANERRIFRLAPVRDINCEGGWDVFNDEWGADISNQYERVFREIRVLTPAARARRLKVAERESIPARAACTKNSIKLPDGTQAKLPPWMLLD
jgi:hypothetical protein